MLKQELQDGAERKLLGCVSLFFYLIYIFVWKIKGRLLVSFLDHLQMYQRNKANSFWPFYVWDMCWNLLREISQNVFCKDFISLCSFPYFEGILLYLNAFCSNTVIPESNIEPVQSRLRTGEVKGVGFGGLLEQTNFTRNPTGNNMLKFTKVEAIWQVATKTVRLRTQRWACFNTYFS